MRAPAFWAVSPPTPLARLLAPFGALYGAITARRMARAGTALDCPVLCVGNFTVGGAGKTPTCVALAQLLAPSGYKIAFVSRGYGGRLSCSKPQRVDPARHTSADVGDEPLLLARVAPCYICQDRVAGARQAQAEGATLIILDDGLQNPALTKNFSLAVIDAQAGFGNGLCLPAGPLRAPLAVQLPHCDAILAIGSGAPDAPWMQSAARHGVPVFNARLVPDANIAAGLNGQRVFAFAGIARPEKFYATLKSTGAELVGVKNFPDHYPFTKADLANLAALAKAQNVIPVTTEKDAMRLSPDWRNNVVALPITLQIDRVSSLLDRIQTKCPRI